MAANDDELGLETPEADRVEQLTPVADDLDESSVGGDVVPGELLDADEADVLEQTMTVPDDDEYSTDGG